MVQNMVLGKLSKLFLKLMVFANAPTLKVAIILGSVLSYWNSVTRKGYLIFYTSTFDWILSSLILYNTRHVEKVLGPSKFIILQILSTTISGIAMYFAGGIPNLALWALTTVGPFYMLIPYSHMTKFGPIPFTNKWYVYAFALQMVFTHPLYIFAPAASFLVFNKFALKFKSKWLLNCDTFLNRIGFTQYKDQTFFNRPNNPYQQQPRAPRNGPPAASPSNRPVINQEAFRQLTDMGFSAEQTNQALVQTNNNVENALMILLNSE
eukprot:NODE_655_length_5500_cov_0.608776.p2 type:complete len:265 gc:universal NODE_655_length_5500_cov_0.608776:1575-2369(+)